VPALDVPTALLAYIGPGAGLDLIGYALTLGAYAITAATAVLLWPAYALLRRLRGRKNPPAAAPPPQDVPGEAHAESRADG
jgi:hypothetical protein